MTETRKLRVFLCHSSTDKSIVREIYQRLNAEGWIDPWLDEEKILPGQDWDMEIEKAVEAADAVIVCLSINSVTKEGIVQKEIRRALDKAEEKPDDVIFIIPLRLEDCPVPRRLRIYQYQDFFSNSASAFTRLYASLEVRADTVGIDIFEIKETLRRQEVEKSIKELEERIRREADGKARLEREEQLRLQFEEAARRKSDLGASIQLGLFSSDITINKLMNIKVLVGIPTALISFGLLFTLSNAFPDIYTKDWPLIPTILLVNLPVVVLESYLVIQKGNYFNQYSKRKLGATIGLIQGVLLFLIMTIYSLRTRLLSEYNWALADDLTGIFFFGLFLGGPVAIFGMLSGFFTGYFLERKNP